MKQFIARASALAMVVVFFMAVSHAQPAGQQQNQAKPLGQGAAPPAKGTPPPTGVTKEELAAYKAVYDARADEAKTITTGEAFIAKYPMSVYAGSVYAELTVAYLHTNQTDKMLDAGTKALAINPDSVDVLPVLAWAIPRGVNSKTPDGPAQLQKAEGYARHGIELLTAMAKPDGLDDAAFAHAKSENLSMCYSGLGTADIKRGKYPEAAMELDQAVALSATPDTVDLYLLGLADEMTSHFTKGIAAFTKCAAEAGPMQAGCKSGIEETKKKAQNSIEAP